MSAVVEEPIVRSQPAVIETPLALRPVEYLHRRTDAAPLSENERQRTARTVIAVVLFGMGLRGFHYLRNPSMWHDEAALVLNVIGKGFHEMFGPLLCFEAAPPLFLWAERAMMLVFGDETWALRLLPFFASCAALLLAVPLARRVLTPRALPWAVLLLACSDRLLWHCCEAKPYSVDVLMAVLLPLLYALTREWSLRRRLGLFTALAPVVVFLTFPGCFLLGGLLVAFLRPLLNRKRGMGGNVASGLAYLLLAVTVFASFALLYLGPIRAQECAPMRGCWDWTFPDWHRPWRLPFWTVWASVEVVDYCFRPFGGALIVPAAVGGLILWRRWQGMALVLGVPVGLALIAAVMHSYPYTGARVMVYAAPAFALVSAEGFAAMSKWLRAQIRKRLVPPVHERTAALFTVTGTSAAILIALYLAFLLPIGRAVRFAVRPWSRPDFAAASAHVLAHLQPGEIVAGNSWETLYYFRHLGPSLVPLGQVPPESRRVWVVVTGKVPREQRLPVAEEVAPGARPTLEGRVFQDIDVLLKGAATSR